MKRSPPGRGKIAPADYIQSLERGLRVIESFNQSGKRLSVSEAAARAGLPRPVARRFLLTLSHLGYADDDGKTFDLTPRVLRLGYSYLSSVPFARIAQQVLQRLADRTGESSSVAVLDGTEIVLIAQEPSKRLVNFGLRVGGRAPAHAASIGRVMLASLSEDELSAYFAAAKFPRFTPKTQTSVAKLREELLRVRRQGWAFTESELENGMIALAVPVIGAANGRNIVAGINVHSHTSITTRREMIADMLGPLREAAAELLNG